MGWIFLPRKHGRSDHLGLRGDHVFLAKLGRRLGLSIIRLSPMKPRTLKSTPSLLAFGSGGVYIQIRKIASKSVSLSIRVAMFYTLRLEIRSAPSSPSPATTTGQDDASRVSRTNIIVPKTESRIPVRRQ